MAESKTTKFNRGRNNGTITCAECGNKVWAERSQSGLCIKCWDKAGDQNMVADGNMTCSEFLATYGEHSEYCDCKEPTVTTFVAEGGADTVEMAHIDEETITVTIIKGQSRTEAVYTCKLCMTVHMDASKSAVARHQSTSKCRKAAADRELVAVLSAPAPATYVWTSSRDPKQASRTYKTTLREPVEATYGTATGAEVWYDRNIQLWTTYLISDEGYQMTPAEYGNTKAEAMAEAESRAEYLLSGHSDPTII